MINLQINNQPVSVPEGSTVLKAAEKLNNHIFPPSVTTLTFA
ncbi:MAG: 2Fe-2S iron-sulfur cluster-binding protein [Bacteroidales bacterium]